MRNDGKYSESLFVKHWEAQGKTVWLERRVDMAHIRGLNRGKPVVMPAQPADFMLTWEGRTYYCEVKSSQDPTAFRLAQFEKAQLAGMLRAGKSYLVFLHNLNADEWYQVDGEFILNQTAKSIPWAELRKHPWVINRA